MDIRQWRDALKAAWQRVSYASELSDWLRRDIGLTADEVKSRADYIDEIRRKYSEGLAARPSPLPACGERPEFARANSG
ncbi:hypothetical protein [Bradyrhizobium liaoningense]|uniref:hypothetical protein n=1 Tax=Bradyrhizobium liaoningense TaxID=43992 RepID=UPI001BAAD6D1|nr:hypothetical protein [Bradyrhizobium liaoningense]MBR1033109.1 hypothetical protein [Bradyrhizobium liaoningense]